MAIQNLRLKYDSYKENNFNSLQEVKGVEKIV